MARISWFTGQVWRGTTSLCPLVALLFFLAPANSLADDTAPSVQFQSDASDGTNAYVARRNALRAQLHGDSSADLLPETHDSIETSAATTPPVIVQSPAPANAPAYAQTARTSASVVPAVQATAAAPTVRTVTSPGIIIKKEVVNLTPDQKPLPAAAPGMLSADQLAALMPAAGDETASPTAPLIPLPDPSGTPAASATVPAPMPVTTAPVGNANLPNKSTLEDIVQRAPEPAGSNAATSAGVAPAALVPSPAAPASAPAPASIASTEPTPLPALPAPAASIASEPQPHISKQSQEIVNKLPTNIDAKNHHKKPLDIEHGKNTDYLKQDAKVPDAQEGISTKQASEAMGMKIEVKAPPAYIDHELQLAYEALVSGQTEEAIGLYKNILSNAPDNKPALFGLATTYHRAGQIDMARPLYGKLLSIDPNNRDALNNFLVLLADEAPQDALVQLQKLENKNPDFSPIPAQMAVIYEKLGDGDHASQKMFRAVALAPENLTYRYNLAIMLDKQHNYEEAAKLYRQIVEAHQRGDVTPGDITKIQERLTFISSNRS